MVDLQSPGSQDGLNDLFGDIAFDRMIAETRTPMAPPPPSLPSLASAPPPRMPQAPAPVAAPAVPIAQHYPSRRDLRQAPVAPGRPRVEQHDKRAEKHDKHDRRVRDDRKAPKLKKQRPAKPSTGAPQPFARPLDSAYPAGRVLVVVRHPKKKFKKRGSGLLTMVAVIGLFGCVALPAYAFAPKSDAAITAAQKTNDDAAVSVSDQATLASSSRGEFGATSATDLKKQRSTALKAANYAAYMVSGARELGDDYPWFSELSTDQGGGLSPLNYFARECVDFVAWRLNRDAGSITAPFLYDWSSLTPSGGNAYQWKHAWKAHGWPTSTTPIVGSVAWFSANHVSYVKAVNADGTVLLEEYNWMGQHLYGQRTIQANEAQLYLYPPPR